MRVKTYVQKAIPTRNLIKKLTVGKTGTSGGITYLVQPDGGILLQGTATENVIFGQGIFGSSAFHIEPGTYTLSGGVNLGVWIQGKTVEDDSISIANNNVSSSTYIFKKAYTFRWNLRITKGYSTNVVIYPMFQHGSVKTEFEPYGENGWTVKKSKNLLNLNKYRLEDYYGKKAVALNVSHLEIGKKYTLSTNCPFIRFIKIGIETGSANSVNYYGNPIKKWSFTMARNPSTPTGTLYLYLGRNWNDVNTKDDFKPYFWQIEEGSTATEYEPYGDYQRVKVWKGKHSVKNLFDTSTKSWSQIGTYKALSKYSFSFDINKGGASPSVLFKTYLPAGTYSMSFLLTVTGAQSIAGSANGLFIGYGTKNSLSPTSWITTVYFTKSDVEKRQCAVTFTSTKDSYIVIGWYGSVGTVPDGIDYKALLEDIQLERGSTATDFEPYNQARMKINIKETEK